MDHKNIYKIPILITVNNNGIIRNVSSEITTLALTPEEAIQQVKDFQVSLSVRGNPMLITLN